MKRFIEMKVETLENKLQLKVNEKDIYLWFYDENTVHFSYATGEIFENACLNQEAKITNFKKSENEDFITIDTNSLTIKIEKKSGEISFIKTEKIVKLKAYELFEKEIMGDKVLGSEIVFENDPTESFYGLGQQQENILDYSGNKIEVFHNYKGKGGEKIGVPFLVSSSAYGIIFNNISQTTVDVNIGGKTTFYGDCVKDASFIISMAENIDELYKSYWQIVGKMPMPLKSSLGYIQCKQRYKTQDEVLEVARKYREKNYPIDMMVVDWFHWKVLGDLAVDETNWQDCNAMNKELNGMDIDCMISVWPRFMKESQNYEHIEKNNWFATNQDGEVVYGTENDRRGALIDTTNPECGKWYFDTIAKNYGEKGFNAWWTDENEPDLWPYEFKLHAGKGYEVFNLYPFTHSKAIYDGHRSKYNHRCCTLSRAAYLGAQQFGTQFWSSDIYPTWEVYEKQITTAINFCATGLGLWSSDIGGWQRLPDEDKVKTDNSLLLETKGSLKGVVTLKDFPELYVRWFQFSVFCPVLRAHGTRNENEVWSYGEDNEKILVDFLKLRYRLMPYIYSNIFKLHKYGTPILRGLFMDFSFDENVKSIKDEFLFGSSILVAPVTKQGENEREVYLPKGVNWYDFFTGEKFKGGQTISVKAELNSIPLFVRENSIIPMGEVVENTKTPQKNIELWVYGENAEFDLYEDDGVSYNYEKGDFNLTKITYKKGELEIFDNKDFNFTIVKK